MVGGVGVVVVGAAVVVVVVVVGASVVVVVVVVVGSSVVVVVVVGATVAAGVGGDVVSPVYTTGFSSSGALDDIETSPVELTIANEISL